MTQTTSVTYLDTEATPRVKPTNPVRIPEFSKVVPAPSMTSILVSILNDITVNVFTAGYAAVLVLAYTFNLAFFVVIAVGMVLPNWVYSKMCPPKPIEVKKMGNEVCDEEDILDYELDVKEEVKNNGSKIKKEGPKKAGFTDVLKFYLECTDGLLDRIGIGL
ncbi:hypothetical protein M7I_6349 [Glarea lozoyensis 74030]|nr:hypothetical protein M7I_6349 [Glarea lozoyensis 74030]